MSRRKHPSANRFRDARRAAARLARKRSGGQMLFPGWFDDLVRPAGQQRSSETPKTQPGQ